MTNKTTRKSLTKGFAWTAVDRFSNLAIQFILGIIIARLITPEEYGVLGILMVFINISQVFIDSGLSSALNHALTSWANPIDQMSRPIRFDELTRWHFTLSQKQ